MRIGNRLFPYPALNSDPSFSEYEECSTFRLCYDTDENDQLPHNSNGQILRNAYFELTDQGLQDLYVQGKVKCGLIFESSASTYRVFHELTQEPQTFELSYRDLKGTVTVSAYLYAVEDIEDYTNPNFQNEYKPYHFDVEKYDVLAIDDGFRFQVNIDPSMDNKVESIITIVPKITTEKQMEYSYNDNNIIVQLPEDYYTRYDNIKGKTDFNNMMFAMIGIPALAGALSDMRKYIMEGAQLDDLTDKYRWVRSVCASFKRVKDKELTEEDLEEMNPTVLAQCVLNDATCNGIWEISEHLLRGKDREEVDDDE